MNWNQISENILCNSEYYVAIYDSDPSRFHRELYTLNTTYINNFIAKNHASFFEEYLQINLPNSKSPIKSFGLEINRRDLILYSDTNMIRTGSYLNILYEYSFDYIHRGIYTGVLGQYYKINKKRYLIKEIRQQVGSNTTLLSLVAENQSLFHFSFHGTDPSLTRIEKRSGAFHLRIDKMLTTSGLRKIQKNFRPFILLDTGKFARFDDFSYVRPKRWRAALKSIHNYTSTVDDRVWTGELQTQFTRKNTSKYLITSIRMNGHTINYVHQIVKPIYDHIVAHLLNPLVPIVFPGAVNPPKLHLYDPTAMKTKRQANNPANVRYCQFPNYTDADIQQIYKFKKPVLHGGKTRKIR
jgi:hypothetical protein